MRQRLAKWLALLTGALVLALAALCADLASRQPHPPVTPPTSPGEAGALADPGEAGARTPAGTHDREALVARGRDVYDGAGCSRCHAIDGRGNNRHPLDGVGARLSPGDIRSWIVAPRSMNPHVRKPAYTFEEPELRAIVAFLAAGPPTWPVGD